MKVLYIGNYYDQTGWSTAAINYILSLDNAGVDVVPRHIKLNKIVGKIPERIIELEQKSEKHPDIVIQHVLPQYMSYNGCISRNIAMYASETDNFLYSNWPKYINSLDEAWVFNSQSKIASLNSGVEIPTHVVSHASDVAKFNRSYTTLPLRDKHVDDFLFYTIGEFNRRKNYASLIKAFHLEFDPDENVQLVIKTTPVGIKGKEAVEGLCNEIKQSLRLYPHNDDYKKEIIFCEHWDDEKIMQLHASTDCFISPSYGEAWCYPAFDALGMGKSVIASCSTGFLSYLNMDNSWLIPTNVEPVFGLHNGIPNLITGRENWYNPDINSLRSYMRDVYSNKEAREQKARIGRRKVREFSHEKIGQIMKNILSGEDIS